MMNKLVRFVAENSWIAAGVVIVLAIVTGLTVSWLYFGMVTREFKSSLLNRVELEAVNLQGITLDSKAMGAVSLAGQFNDDVRAATQETDIEAAKTRNIANLSMSLLASSISAENAFVVNHLGQISSDWDAQGSKLIGLDVKFRPYYQAATHGVLNVHGAVSMSTGKRMLYVAGPVYKTAGNSGPIAGAVVARFNIDHIDTFLGRLNNVIGVLVTPHAVVFASNREDWRMRPLGTPDEDRLHDIRVSKQYGKFFTEGNMPPSLPEPVNGEIILDGDRYLVVKSPIIWNDPAGNWSLMLMGNLSNVLPMGQRVMIGLAASLLAALFGGLLIHILRSQNAQYLASEKLSNHAAEQQLVAAQKSHIAAASKYFQHASSLPQLV